MSYIERKNEILSIISAYGGACKINTICDSIFASRSTIRRDLIILEEAGIITRYHGSVVMRKNSASEASAVMRKMENPHKKSYIAKLTQPLISNNMVIFFDSSTTTSYLIPLIRHLENVTIITNGINIAMELSNSKNITCYMCPGLLKNQSYSIVGEYSIDFLENFTVQAAFLSCKAIDNKGVFEGNDQQAFIKRKMLQNAHQKILLCDSTKELKKGYFKLADFDCFDVIISDKLFSPELMKSINKANCAFICD